MKRLWIVPILICAATLWLLLSRRADHQPEEGTKKEVTSLITLPDMQRSPFRPANPASAAPALMVFENETWTDRLLHKLNPEALEQHVGSYSPNDFKNSEDPSYTLKLNSRWIWSNTNLPQTVFRVQLNPQTGGYEFKSGELFLPRSNLGLSYEIDLEADESQTFLKWKKEF